MKKKRFYSGWAAAAAILMGTALSACSSDETIEGGKSPSVSDAAISYGVGMDSKLTRGLGLSSSDLTNEGLIPNMQVWAYYAPDAQGTGVTAGAMYIGKDANTGITVTNTGGVWQEDAQYTAYWPAETATLNFQAIAPATHESITSITNEKENDLAHMVANVTIPQENAKQVDILMANTDKVTKGTSSRKVQFDFKHVLSQIRFSVKTASEQVSGEIKGISLCNIKETGTVGFHKGDDTGDAANNYAVALVQHEPADLTRNTEYPIGMIADGTFDSEYFVGKTGEGYPKVKDMTAANGSLLLLPQTTTKWATVDGTPVSIATANAAYNTYIKVYCKIKNGDTYLVGSDDAYGEVYIPFAANWQMGKKYVYTINIGTGNGGFDAEGNPLILPIKYSVDIDEWDQIVNEDVPQDFTHGRENGYEWVDLGLPSGLKWATCNVGATSPEQAGLYFAWGETTGYTADQVNGGERKFDSSSYTASSISADLTLEQDAAHANLGGNWRMPTKAEFEELKANCTATWTTDYNGTGVKGRIFTSKTNGNSVFFPASGGCYGSSVLYVGSDGSYWSASWYSSNHAGYLDFDSGDVIVDYNSRLHGRPVRGVCE